MDRLWYDLGMNKPNRVPNDTCSQCGKGVYTPPSQLGGVRNCSTQCFKKWIWNRRPEAIRHCRHCRKQFRTNPAYIRRRKSAGIYCSRQCFDAHRSIPRKGIRDSHGYISMRGVRGIRQHRWIIEQHLGRKLSTSEHVHHINGNKSDNRIENLEVMTATKHHRLHGSRVIKNGETYECDKCGKCRYYPQSTRSRLGETYRCISCRKIHGFAPGTGPGKQSG